MNKRKFEKTELFVMVTHETLDALAWRAMSHGARSLFVALRRRYRHDLKNNGNIFLSLRQAEIELGSKRDYIARWFRELQHYGFIVMTRPGFLGNEGRGKAPHWRLTDVGYLDDPPTKDFLAWNGAEFKTPRKISRPPKADHPWSANGGHMVVRKSGPGGPQKGAI